MDDTRPPAGTRFDYEELADEYDRRNFGNHNSARAIINDKSKGFIVAVLVAINAIATVMMFVEWRAAERETRMLEYYLLELDAKFIAAGLKKSDEAIAEKLRKDKGEGK